MNKRTRQRLARRISPLLLLWGAPLALYLGALILPRFGGQSHYAAIAAVCDLNSNSIGLT
jgi:hypothetical protein